VLEEGIGEETVGECGRPCVYPRETMIFPAISPRDIGSFGKAQVPEALNATLALR